jgi:SagB-type dehydrogenase family enzyme
VNGPTAPRVVGGDAARKYLTVADQLPVLRSDSMDWRKMPPSVKRYPRVSAIPVPGLLNSLLRSCYGFTRYQWDTWQMIVLGVGGRVWLAASGRPLRPVPSGGGLASPELYLAGHADGLPAGIYHYDPAADALDVLLSGTEEGGSRAGGPLWILIGSVFARTAFKYHEFGYRLQCLDAGTLAGQILVQAEAAGIAARLVTCLDEPAVASGLGLDPQAETVLAAVALEPPGAAVTRRPPTAPEAAFPRSCSGPARPTPRTAPRPVLASLPLTAALCTAGRQARGGGVPPPVADPAALPHQRAIRLPGATAALSAGTAKRRSADGSFTVTPTTLEQATAIASAAGGGWTGDIGPGHVLVFCVVHNVTGLDRGVYAYEPAGHRLLLLYAADLRAAVRDATGQAAALGDYHAGLVIYPVGDYERGFGTAGDGWFRMQNIAAGIAAQRAALAAAAVGLGCRVTCSYQADAVTALLRLPGTFHPLCQITVGPVAGAASFTQPLHQPGESKGYKP